jgi:DNA-directed RNA polymerase specialized sigma24 family protein
MQSSSAAGRSRVAVTAIQERRDAFRDLHRSRLYGFALLLTLGDRARAARLTDAALTAGARRSGDLSHPERGAAWLRRHVLHATGPRFRSKSPRCERLAALEPLHVDEVAFEALAALRTRERAALVAAGIERLDARDVATIVDLDSHGLERLLRRARRRAASASAVATTRAGSRDGPIETLIHAVAARAMS